jgi:hypothetical protein
MSSVILMISKVTYNLLNKSENYTQESLISQDRVCQNIVMKNALICGGYKIQIRGYINS